MTVWGNTIAAVWVNTHMNAWGNINVAVWGNSNVTLSGNSDVTVCGNTNVTVRGNNNVTVWGNSNVTEWGNTGLLLDKYLMRTRSGRHGWLFAVRTIFHICQELSGENMWWDTHCLASHVFYLLSMWGDESKPCQNTWKCSKITSHPAFLRLDTNEKMKEKKISTMGTVSKIAPKIAQTPL